MPEPIDFQGGVEGPPVRVPEPEKIEKPDTDVQITPVFEKPANPTQISSTPILVVTTPLPTNINLGAPLDPTVFRPPSSPSLENIPGELGSRFIKDRTGRIGMGTSGKGPKPTIHSEDAVIRGLKWLRDHQNEDGSWGERSKAGMTGLALLCFLGHGELPSSREYGFCIEKALQWVLSNGEKSQGRLSMTGEDWGPGNGGVYEHGIVTYALGEYYSISKDQRVLELLKQAVEHIVSGQATDGGWMYHFDKTKSDTSVSGWQVQALKAAHLAGLEPAKVDRALDKAMLNFDRVQGPNGGYGYRDADDRYSLTGVGLLCEKFWGHGRNKDLRKSVDFIREKSDKEFPVKYLGESGDLYAWYYHTQGMLMFGGGAWNDWERKFQKEIIDAQAPNGSWPVMRAPGHGNLQTDTNLTGAVYRTTFSVLILESYYRYMPTNRADIGAGTNGLALR